MHLINKPRGFGKTQALVQMLKEDDNAIMLVSSYQRAKQITDLYGIPRSRVLKADPESLRGLPRSNRYLVDDIDIVLYSLLGVPVDTGTISS